MKTLPLILLSLQALFLLSCSKSNPQIIEQKPIVRTEVKEYRVMNEALAVDKVLASELPEEVIADIQKTHRSDFSWKKFWWDLNQKRALLTPEMLLGLSQLSSLQCSDENTKAYFTLVENFFSEKAKLLPSLYLGLLKQLFYACSLNVSQEQVEAFKARIEASQESLKESKQGLKDYISILSALHKRTEFLVLGDPYRLVNEYLLKQVLSKSLNEDDLALFSEVTSLFHVIYPDKKISAFINPGEMNVSKEKLERLASNSSFNNFISYLSLVARENRALVKEQRELLFQKIAKETHKNTHKMINDAVSHTAEALTFYFSLAESSKEKIELLNLSNSSINELIKRFGSREIDAALLEEHLTDGFKYLLKSVVAHVRPAAELQVKASEELSFISLNMAKLLTESDLLKAANLAEAACKNFSELGITVSELQELKSSDVGCHRLGKDKYKVRNLSFNLYSLYLADGKDISLEGKTSRGGIFNLSAQTKIVDLEVQNPENYIQSNFISTLLAIKERQNRIKLVPFCWPYQDVTLSSKIYVDNEPKKGNNGGNLIINYSEHTERYPKLISLGNAGQLRKSFVVKSKEASKIIPRNEIIDLDLEKTTVATTEMLTLYSIRKLVENAGTFNNFKPEFGEFYQQYLVNPNPELQEFARKEGLTSLEKINNVLIKEAEKIIQRENDFLSYFTFECQVPQVEFKIEEKNGQPGTQGTLQIL